MKNYKESVWRQRALYFLAGAVFAIICGVIQFKWMDIVPYVAFDQQPSWLKLIKDIVGWLPWAVCFVVLVFRFIKGANIRIWSYFLGTAAPMVVLISWMLFGISIKNTIYSKKFDEKEWKNNEIAEHNRMWPPRLIMVDDLIASKKLDGLSKKEVIDILGEPGKHGYFSQFDLVYRLGPERGFIRIDSEWLAISLDNNDRVNEYRLVRD